MNYDEIIKLFESERFDNDVWSKIDYIMSKTDKYTQQELIDIYDELTGVYGG